MKPSSQFCAFLFSLIFKSFYIFLRELVDKYRVLVKEREAIHEEVNNCLMTSEFLPPAFANTLATFPLDQFCQGKNRPLTFI